MTDDIAPTPEPAPDIEDRLRHALAAKAGAGPVSPADWGDFAGRLASTTRRRQRVLVGAAALALCVGAAGGYLGEAAASPGAVAARVTGQKATAGGSASSGRTGSAAPSAEGPAAICNGASGTASSGTSSSGTSSSGTSSSGTSSSGTSSGGSASDIDSATRLFIRTTADGVAIRAYEDAPVATPCVVAPTPQTGPVPGGDSSGSTGSGPASTLMPLIPTASDVTIELSDDDAVGQGSISSPQCVLTPAGGGATGSGGQSGSSPASPPAGGANAPVITPATTTTTTATTTTTTTSPTPTTPPAGASSEPLAIDSGAFGVVEGDPVWWVAVEVSSDVTSVEMTFPDGSTDQMAPVDGVAVLAHRVTAAVASAGTGPYDVRGTLQILGAGGTVLSTVTLPQTPTSAPGPVAVPLPAPVPSNQGSTAVNPGGAVVSPGVMVECPPTGTLAPQAQSSASTEKR
jgi:hypothetical protein